MSDIATPAAVLWSNSTHSVQNTLRGDVRKPVGGDSRLSSSLWLLFSSSLCFAQKSKVRRSRALYLPLWSQASGP